MKDKKRPGGREGATTANRERSKPFVQGEAYNRAAKRGVSGLSSPHIWVPAHLACQVMPSLLLQERELVLGTEFAAKEKQIKKKQHG